MQEFYIINSLSQLNDDDINIIKKYNKLKIKLKLFLLFLNIKIDLQCFIFFI